MIETSVNAINYSIKELNKTSSDIAKATVTSLDSLNESITNKTQTASNNKVVFENIKSQENFNLEKAITDMIQQEKSVGYNVKAIQTQNEMMGSLLDIRS